MSAARRTFGKDVVAGQRGSDPGARDGRAPRRWREPALRLAKGPGSARRRDARRAGLARPRGGLRDDDRGGQGRRQPRAALLRPRRPVRRSRSAGRPRRRASHGAHGRLPVPPRRLSAPDEREPAAARRCVPHAAVPQTGPLPGAFRRSALPALEASLRAGELAVRSAIAGLRVAEVHIEPTELANVNTRADLARVASHL